MKPFKVALIGLAVVLVLMLSMGIYTAATISDHTTSTLTGVVEVATPAP